MKRIGLILATLVGIVVFAFLANRATRIPVTRAVNTNQETKPTASPDFTLKDLEDHDVSLSQFKGKVVLVNFWATWCGPCRIEIPWLVELQGKYAARGFTVLGVAMDEEGKSAVAPFVQKERFKVGGTSQSMNYPIVLGSDATADKFGGSIGFPTSVLISKDGRLRRNRKSHPIAALENRSGSGYWPRIVLPKGTCLKRIALAASQETIASSN